MKNQKFKKMLGSFNEKCTKNYIKVKCTFSSERGDFGMSSVIGIAIGLILAAFVLIPGLKIFAEKIMLSMNNWWIDSIAAKIFPTS